MPTSVSVDREGPVWTLTLDGPSALNALGETTLLGLRNVIDELTEDSTARVVLVRGAGNAFSAGADLKDSAAGPRDWIDRSQLTGRWQRVLADLERLPQVTIASLHGWVIGGAVLLAAACDLRIGGDDVRFRIPEVALGIPLTWAGLPMLVREIGLPATRDLVMSCRTVEAEEALRLGLLQRLVPRPDLDTAVTTVVDGLVAMPAGPLAMTKRALAAIGETVAPSSVAWSDPDLLAWSSRDPESRQAMADYVTKNLSRSEGRSGPSNRDGPASPA